VIKNRGSGRGHILYIKTDFCLWSLEPNEESDLQQKVKRNDLQGE
jgi:hypothetical protein